MADRHAGFGRRIHDIALDLFVDGREERALVDEVVLQRTTAHPGRGNDRLARCARVPMFGEEVTGGGEQRRARRFRPLRLGLTMFQIAS